MSIVSDIQPNPELLVSGIMSQWLDVFLIRLLWFHLNFFVVQVN